MSSVWTSDGTMRTHVCGLFIELSLVDG